MRHATATEAPCSRKNPPPASACFRLINRGREWKSVPKRNKRRQPQKSSSAQKARHRVPHRERGSKAVRAGTSNRSVPEVRLRPTVRHDRHGQNQRQHRPAVLCRGHRDKRPQHFPICRRARNKQARVLATPCGKSTSCRPVRCRTMHPGRGPLSLTVPAKPGSAGKRARPCRRKKRPVTTAVTGRTRHLIRFCHCDGESSDGVQKNKRICSRGRSRNTGTPSAPPEDLPPRIRP